jgi:hypothetical protein
LNLEHGLSQSCRAERLDKVAVRELRDAVLTDQGGEPECSAVRRALIDDFAQAVVLRDAAYSYIATVGPLTKKGYPRAVCKLWSVASARVERLAAQIGLQRVPRPIAGLLTHLTDAELATVLRRAREQAGGPATAITVEAQPVPEQAQPEPPAPAPEPPAPEPEPDELDLPLDEHAQDGGEA